MWLSVFSAVWQPHLLLVFRSTVGAWWMVEVALCRVKSLSTSPNLRYLPMTWFMPWTVIYYSFFKQIVTVLGKALDEAGIGSWGVLRASCPHKYTFVPHNQLHDVNLLSERRPGRDRGWRGSVAFMPGQRVTARLADSTLPLPLKEKICRLTLRM